MWNELYFQIGAPMWALACMAQSLPAINSTHALRMLLITCVVCECWVCAWCWSAAALAGCCKLWVLWFAACSLHTAQQLLVDHFVPPARPGRGCGGWNPGGPMWPVSWGHQCCESPAAFGCVVVMCVVGWGRSDDIERFGEIPPRLVNWEVLWGLSFPLYVLGQWISERKVRAMRDHPAENSVLGIRDDPWHNARNWLVWFGQWTSAGATDHRS